MACNKGCLCTGCDAKHVTAMKTSERKQKMGEQQQGKNQRRMYGASGRYEYMQVGWEATMMFERARDFVTERPSAWQLRVRKPKDRTQHDTGLHVASFRLGTHATFRLVRILYRPRLSICCCARLHHVISERNKSEIALQREEPLQRFVIQHVVSSLIGQDCLAIY